MSFGKKKRRSQQQQQVQERRVEQRQLPAQSLQELQQQQAAGESELFRLFLMQRLAQQQFQAPLMDPLAQEGLRTINEQFRDERDIRGFGGIASPIETARGQAIASYMARLQNEAFSKRLALSGVLGPSPGGLGLMGLQQQARIAGAPNVMTNVGTTTGRSTETGRESGLDFGSLLGGAGSLMTGVGNLYGAYRGWAPAGSVTRVPTSSILGY